ncbi:MAG: amidohydrolase [Pedosphaera sp.]|nr:amidohydrolase [Pedosphaera sp.]PHX95882.1 MAG: amidohydrolase [Pedosphaera sp.]
MFSPLFRRIFSFALPSLFALVAAAAEPADFILRNAKVATVDAKFSLAQAIAVRGDKLIAVGSNADLAKLAGPNTRIVDAKGRLVIPGLMDSHTHPSGASLYEFDHAMPEMESIADVLAYIKSRAAIAPEGQWITTSQIFITRLKEQRYPTRAELDAAAPKHPVAFQTGPDASVNSLALHLNKIDRNFQIPAGVPGKIEKDAAGEPTGILRTSGNYFKTGNTGARSATEAQRTERLVALFKDYNSVGITTICDRNAGLGAIESYAKLRDAGALTVRVSASQGVGSLGELAKIQESIRAVAKHKLHTENDDWVRIIGIKMFLDGGMLTGSAYMREPWGLSEIYSITDPQYRGVLFIPKERLKPMVRTAVESGLQFTAHSVGDGAVHTLMEVYEELAKEGLPIRQTRACVTHSNFMSKESVETAARLGVVLDIQPAWLYLDTRTLTKQFGYDRLRYFQPLKSIFAAGGLVGGGSDHMQKIGSFRSVNPYNPFLGMQTAITRRAKWHEGQLHPEEALTREEALRFYTINNAQLLFKETRTGSLEPGKLADLALLDTDLLTCAEDKIAQTKALLTMVGGKVVWEAK